MTDDKNTCVTRLLRSCINGLFRKLVLVFAVPGRLSRSRRCSKGVQSVSIKTVYNHSDCRYTTSATLRCEPRIPSTTAKLGRIYPVAASAAFFKKIHQPTSPVKFSFKLLSRQVLKWTLEVGLLRPSSNNLSKSFGKLYLSWSRIRKVCSDLLSPAGVKYTFSKLKFNCRNLVGFRNHCTFSNDNSIFRRPQTFV